MTSTLLSCFKAYDIRGKVPQDLNHDIAYRTARALVEFLGAKKIVIGYDVRESSMELADSITKGITDGGADSYNIGLCGTEMVYFSVPFLEADGGIMITASHNPPEYNGMKCVREGAKPISADSGLKEIEQRVIQNQFQSVPISGKVKNVNVIDDYIEHVLSFVDVEKIKPLKVVVNAGNGCAGPVLDKLEKHLPVEMIKEHHEPDATFPNGVPNPMIEENRLSTIESIQSNRAALGVAWDGDYDRCFFFDENGSYIEGYYIVGFLAETILRKTTGAKIVHDPRLTWNTVEIVESNGGTPVQSRSGHSFIKEVMRKEDAHFGGEMSCHLYFKEFSYCDSGMIPFLMMLEILSDTGRMMSELVRERIQKFPISGEINNTVKDQDAVIQTIQKHYQSQNPKIDETDGLSFEFEEWRFNVRKSNTEPILRLNIETRNDLKLLEQKKDELLKLIHG